MADGASVSRALPQGTTVLAVSKAAGSVPGSGIHEDGQMVDVRTPSGSRASVFIPDSVVQNTDKVVQMISDKVNAVEAIHSLSNP